MNAQVKVNSQNHHNKKKLRKKNIYFYEIVRLSVLVGSCSILCFYYIWKVFSRVKTTAVKKKFLCEFSSALRIYDTVRVFTRVNYINRFYKCALSTACVKKSYQ